MTRFSARADGRVLWLTLADPESGNALDRSMVTGLLDAIVDGKQRAEILVLQGEGEVFSRGRPRRGAAHAAGEGATAEMRAALTDLVALNRALRSWPGVALAAVQGGAWGAACGVAVHCDVVLADEDARFGFPEITYNLPPALVSAYLPKWISPKAAHYLALTGQEISARLALSWGLVAEVVPEGTLGRRVSELVAFLAAREPGALRACKEALLGCRWVPDAEAYPRGVDLVLSWMSREFRQPKREA